MASENETVAGIVSEIRTIPWKVYNQEIESDDGCGITQSYCNTLADRIEAAHKREKDALMRNLNALEKAVEETCGKDLIERIAARKKEIQNGRQ